MFDLTKSMEEKIITAMKFMYFIVLNCLSISCYTSMCNFAKAVDFRGLLTTKDYTIYTNIILGREFVIIIAQYIESN